jgi:hypothetical protein
MKTAIPVGYARQGYIYFTSLAYRNLSAEQKKKIVDLVKEAGGDNWEALLEYVTTTTPATIICEKHFIGNKKTLHMAVRKYYMAFPKRIP